MVFEHKEDESKTDPLLGVDERGAAGMFALEIIHEIRNPLEALSHLTYLAHEEADDSDQVRKYMQLAEEQVATLSRIVKQTLGFARSSVSLTPTDLVELAEAALRIHQRTVETKRIHLVKDLSGDLLASVHNGLMLQAVSNLIVNALDALPTEGTLTLRMRRRKGTIHLIVADNGHGIRSEHLDQLFKPFFTTKGDAGNGLGLALTQKVVNDHHGRISVRSSVREGRNGTAFKVSFPA